LVVKGNHAATPQEVELNRKLDLLKLANRVDRVYGGKYPIPVLASNA